MKTRMIILCLIVMAFAYTVPDSLRNEAKSINDLLINCQFDSAKTIYESLLEKDSTEPLYYYLKLASLGLEALDRDEFLNEDDFTETYKRGMKLLDSNKQLETDSYLTMLKGFMYTSFSAFQLIGGKYFSAVGKGKDGLAAIERSRELDSTNHDLDYYLGFFNYAQGDLKERVPILFWLDDSSQEGLSQLRRCREKGLFMNNAADMVLVDVMIRENELVDGETMLYPMMGKYPQSRFLLWTEARLKEAQNDTIATVDVYTKLTLSYFQDHFCHNGFITAFTALEYLESSPEEHREYVKFLLENINKTRVTSSEMKQYEKLEALIEE